jgi:hypothetical protein
MITWNTDVNAPCCPGEIIDEQTGRTILIQTDWDYPGVASSFGWSVQRVQRCPECGGPAVGPNIGHCQDCDHAWEPCCGHPETDGTVDCPCGVTASDFISAAADWLRENDGATAEDPGYFQMED